MQIIADGKQRETNANESQINRKRYIPLYIVALPLRYPRIWLCIHVSFTQSQKEKLVEYGLSCILTLHVACH